VRPTLGPANVRRAFNRHPSCRPRCRTCACTIAGTLQPRHAERRGRRANVMEVLGHSQVGDTLNTYAHVLPRKAG
jgi:hypothetical protein